MVGYESSRVLTTSADYFKRRALFFFRITANFDSVCLISRASRLTMQQIHCRPMLFFFFAFLLQCGPNIIIRWMATAHSPGGLAFLVLSTNCR